MTKKPAAPAKRPGRPDHQPTTATRRQVSIAAGSGMRHQDIAIALQISIPTLVKYYMTELSVGANQRRMEVMNGLYLAAKKGRSSAAKAYLALEPEALAPPEGIGDGKAPPVAEQGTAGVPVGKKEQAQRDAVTAQVGTEWDGLLKPPASMQ